MMKLKDKKENDNDKNNNNECKELVINTKFIKKEDLVGD